MRVSVVIPSYNHRDYVVQAIESVLDQSWPDLDLIVIDDGSTDGSPETIRELHERRGGFRFVARENRGLIKTLNQGLAMAEGEFFCELASDDYFPVDSIEKRTRFLIEHPDHVAVFGDGSIVEKGKPTGATFNVDRTRGVLEKDDPIPDMLHGRKPVFCTGLIRTAVLREIGGFDDATFRYYEDLDTPIRLALEGRLGLVESKVIIRRVHETNVSSTTPFIRLEKIALYRKLLSCPHLKPYRRILVGKLAKNYVTLGRIIGSLPEDLASIAREQLKESWKFGFYQPRLFFYLLKYKIQ